MKKKLLLIISAILLIFSIFFFATQTMADTVDITTSITINNIPNSVTTGQSGNLQGNINDIQGLSVEGTIKYHSSDPSILTVTSDGHWKAIAPGNLSIVPVVVLSKKSINDLQAKFPDDDLITRDVLQSFPVTVTQNDQAIYRLYNPNSGEHFYTLNNFERNNLKSLGWYYEGIGWNAPNNGISVYRLYNPNSGEHFYTINSYERDNLKSLGWHYEGIGWYSITNGVPIYRLYNKNDTGSGAHHYTNNAVERENLTSLGWRYEGISWYGQ